MNVKTISSIILLVLFTSISFAQYKYEPSKDFPFGKYNPEAPVQLKDYEQLIGESKCKSFSIKKDRTWASPVNMIWRWKYIMNGKAIQDKTLKEDGSHSGSIRQYDIDSLRWNVHYYSSKGITKRLSTWHGNKKEGKIILYRDQKAPNGTEGFYRLTFFGISDKGYNWVGEWTDKTETVVFPTWKIECKKE